VLTIDDEQSHLSEYNVDQMEDRLAWREGMIVINDETLDYVINEFGRYSEQKVLLADRKRGETRVAGYFRLGDVDALLIALEKNFKIRSEYYQTTNTYVLSQL
jgi:transmembrane sensor